MDSRCGAFLCRTVLKQVPRWGVTTLTFFDSKSCHQCCLIQNKLNLKRMSKNVKTVPFHSLRSLATDINDREHRPPILEGQLNGPGGPRPGVEDVPSGRNVLVIADAFGVVQKVSGKVLLYPLAVLLGYGHPEMTPESFIHLWYSPDVTLSTHQCINCIWSINVNIQSVLPSK